MSEVEHRSIDGLMAFHSAPTLLGVKCANLVSFDRNEHIIAEYLHEFASELSDSGLCAKQLCRCRKRTLVYIYNEKMHGSACRRLLTSWASTATLRT